MDIGGSAPPVAAEAPATPLSPVENNGPTLTQQGMTDASGQRTAGVVGMPQMLAILEESRI